MVGESNADGRRADEVDAIDAVEDERQGLEEHVTACIKRWECTINELCQLDAAAGSAPVRGLKKLIKQQQAALERTARKLRQALTDPDLTLAQCRMSVDSQLGPGSAFSWETRWRAVKQCRGLLQFNKEFPWTPRRAVPLGEDWSAMTRMSLRERPVATVDAVVDNGRTWLKFVAVSQKNLERQIKVASWEGGAGNEDGVGDVMDLDDRDDIEFVWAIRDIVLTARWNHCRHVHIVFPRIVEGQSDAVDSILRRIQNDAKKDVGLMLSFANSLILTSLPPPLGSALCDLLDRDPLADDTCGTITSTVNLDPSILIGLASDLGHGPLDAQPPFQRKIIALAQEESMTGGDGTNVRDTLVNVLYPALRGRRLLCTRWAATYFRKVIDAIATSSEETRAALILPTTHNTAAGADKNDGDKTSVEMRHEFQRWSSTLVPEDLLLPVQIVDDIGLEDVERLVRDQTLPPMAYDVAADLSPLNQSVCLYGWAHRLTTLSGHRGMTRQIELSVARHWTRESEYVPDFWVRRMVSFLVHRDKPKNWRDYLPDGAVPPEVARWANEWTTWGRGISSGGLPDSKTWEGVGHPEQQGFGTKRTKASGVPDRGSSTSA